MIRKGDERLDFRDCGRRTICLLLFDRKTRFFKCFDPEFWDSKRRKCVKHR